MNETQSPAPAPSVPPAPSAVAGRRTAAPKKAAPAKPAAKKAAAPKKAAPAKPAAKKAAAPKKAAPAKPAAKKAAAPKKAAPVIQKSTRKRAPADNPFLKLRVDLKMNQTVFWKRVGVTQSGGSRYESSARRVPPAVKTLVTLAYGPKAEADRILKQLRAD